MLSSKLYSSFDPRSLGGCVLWLDAADTTTMTLSGSNVTQWRDKSGNGGNGTATNTPTISRDVFGGRQTVFFSSNAYFLGATSITGTSLTAFAVVQLTALPSSVGNMRVLSLGTPSNYDYDSVERVAVINVNQFTVPDTFAVYREGAQWAAASATIATNAPYLVCSTLDGSIATIHTNGTIGPRSLSTTGTFAITSYGVGNQSLPTTEFLRGYLGEILLFNSALSTAQRQLVEGYLASKWGLGRTAPSTISLSAPSASLLFSPTMWLDATDTTTIDLSGTSVTQWRDKSGNSNHTTSVTGTVTYSSNAVNGRQGVYLNSSYFRGAVSITTSNVQAFAVATLESDAPNFAYLLALSSNTGADSWNNTASLSPFGRNGTTTTLRTIRNANSAFGPNAITYAVPFLVGSCNVPGVGNINTNAQAYGTVGNGATGAFGITAFALGSDTNTGAGQFWKGYISEVLVYNKVLTTDQRNFVENYLMQKWNVTSLIPLTHPYRYSPPLMRPFNPLDISGCVLWMDATDPTTLTLSGSNVTQWRDKSGRGYVFNNLPGQSSPSLTNTFNGTRPCVESTTTSMIMGTAYDVSTTSIHGPQGLSYFLVQRFGSGIVAVQYERNGVAGTRILNYETSNWLTYYGPTYGNAGVQTTTPCVMSTVVNLPTSNLFGYMNGSNVVTASGVSIQNLSCNAGWGLFGLNDTANGGMFGSVTKIAEFIQYSVPLTDAQRQQVEAYLVAKWGLLGTTPSNHPARLAPALAPQFSPVLLGSCAIWLDAADQSTLTLSGSNATAWRDKSGLARTYTGTVAYTTANGYPCLRFASNRMTATSNYATSNLSADNANFTCFTVINVSNTTGVNSVAVGLNWTSAAEWRFETFYSSNSTTVFFDGGGFVANPRLFSTYTQNTRQIHGFRRFSGSNLMFRRNGAAIASNTTATPSNWQSNSTYTANLGGLGSIFVGDIHEVLFFSNDIGVAACQQIEGYLARKWGLLSDLSTTNPYKTTPIF